MSRKFEMVPVGMFEVNCYLVPSPGGKILYIIDPGGDPEDIAEAAKKFSCEENVILFTHAHIDHIACAGKCAKLLNVKRLYIHPSDEEMYNSASNALPPYYPAATDLPAPAVFPPEDPALEILHTPGHTPGGVCYYFAAYNALFSGDTLFRASVGRTDLPGGNTAALLSSLKNILSKYDDSVEVFPGHGYSTTIGFEKKNNPFIDYPADEVID
ncbi:MAG: MBL fold metallo-hydrolase [Lentisphaeria bacterium]|nr:MBL fold metallo-hydrolase [Lentisphaeria bacterium]